MNNASAAIAVPNVTTRHHQSGNDAIAVLDRLMHNVVSAQTTAAVNSRGKAALAPETSQTRKGIAMESDVTDDTVYLATPRGQTELQTSAHILSQRMRRVLFLIDGIKTVADLSLQTRAGEIMEILRELEAGGFAERVSVPEIIGDTRMLTEAIDNRRLAEIKRAVISDLRARLGSAADFVIGEIERCESALQLRGALRMVEDVLHVALGEADVVDHLRAVGKKVIALSARRA